MPSLLPPARRTLAGVRGGRALRGAGESRACLFGGADPVGLFTYRQGPEPQLKETPDRMYDLTARVRSASITAVTPSSWYRSPVVTLPMYPSRTMLAR